MIQNSEWLNWLEPQKAYYREELQVNGSRRNKTSIALFFSKIAFFFSPSNLPNRVAFYTDVFWACQAIDGKGFCDESKESLSRRLNLMLVFVIQSFNFVMLSVLVFSLVI